VGRLLLIDALTTAAALALWYFCFVQYNHRRGEKALSWVEAACSGRGRVMDSRWFGYSRLQAHIGLITHSAHEFENAKVTIRLRPRPMPVNWMLSIWRKQKETLTFEADLDYAPGFRLEVFRHRWQTHKLGSPTQSMQDWTISRPGPIVLTTRSEWNQELTPVVNTLMTSRGHNLVSVRFRPESPQLAASVDLESLSDEQTAAAFLGVLRDLAVGASTPRQ
jgi:hypothetical protein